LPLRFRDVAPHRSRSTCADETGCLPRRYLAGGRGGARGLLEALRSGRLGGFALDPLYEEPGRSDEELLSFENVVLTPHMAGSPRFNGLRDIEDLINGLAREMSK
jgi:hypothetical protein